MIEQVLLSNPDTRGLVTVVIALIIIVALLRQPALGRVRPGQGPLAPRRAAAAARPPTASVRSIAGCRGSAPRSASPSRSALAYVVSNETASVLTAVAGYTLVGLSVGLLTGVSGQLSLGQFAYAGIAAAASVHVVDSTGNFLLRRALRRASGGVASVLVGIPAMRLRGLALAVSTLAFALATSTWLLRQDLFLGDGVAPAKPTWWDYPLDFAVDYYLFALLVLVLGVWFTNNLRHGGFGRITAGAARQRGRRPRVHGAEPDADDPALRRLRRAGRPRRHRDRPRPVAAHGQLLPGRRPASTSSRSPSSVA